METCSACYLFCSCQAAQIRNYTRKLNYFEEHIFNFAREDYVNIFLCRTHQGLQEQSNVRTPIISMYCSLDVFVVLKPHVLF